MEYIRGDLFTRRINRRNLVLGSISVYVVLFLVLIIILSIVSFVPFLEEILNFIFLILFFSAFIFSTSLWVRRTHDLGWGGWWALLLFIPYIGFIFLIVLLVKEGEKAANKYGEVPPQKVRFPADILGQH